MPDTATKKRWAVNTSLLETKTVSFQPTESQRSAIKGLQKWFSNWSGSPVYKEPAILEGFAGSGKTATVCQLIFNFIYNGDYTFQDEFKVALIAPTNRAKEVLRSFSQDRELWKFCKVSVFTTHSLGGMISDGVNEDGYLNDIWNEKSEHQFDLVVVDEFSMIDDLTLYPNLAPLFSRFPFLFVGDLNQLPPVIGKEKQSTIKPGESIVTINHPKYCFKLDQVVRYSGSILAFSHEILAQYSCDSKVVTLPKTLSFDGRLLSQNIDDYIMNLDRYLPSDLIDRDILDFKVLCFTNDRVAFWNKLIRQQLYPELADKSKIQPTDHLIVKEPIYKLDRDEKMKLCFYTNEFFIPEAVENGIVLTFEDTATGLYISDLEFQRIYARNTFSDVVFLYPTPDTLIKLSQYGIHQIKQINQISDPQKRKKAYNTLIDLLKLYGLTYKNDPNLKNPFKRQVIPFYSSTIHSCQGTTLRDATVDWDDIHKAQSSDMRKRLAYVASTRATDRLMLCSASVEQQENFDDNPF